MLLMTFATKSTTTLSAGTTRAMVATVAGLKAVIRAINHRRDVLRLTELDERCLKDIGLMRSDVEGALATSWLEDPSRVLASRSGQSTIVAAARREEGLRQAIMKSPATPARAEPSVACSV